MCWLGPEAAVAGALRDCATTGARRASLVGRGDSRQLELKLLPQLGAVLHAHPQIKVGGRERSGMEPMTGLCTQGSRTAIAAAAC